MTGTMQQRTGKPSGRTGKSNVLRKLRTPMDWHIGMSRDGETHVARLSVDRVTFTFYGETRESAWVLALNQLLEIEKSRRLAESAVELWEKDEMPQEEAWN